MLKTKFFNQTMPGILLLLTIHIQFSCKKNNHLPPKDNEIKTTVTFSSGVVLNTYATGWNAGFGCDIYGFSSSIASRDEVNGNISVSRTGPCVTIPETTDKVSVQYVRYPNSQASPVYYNTIVRTPGGSLESSGSVTFTVINGDYWEGYFDAVCWSPRDSDSIVVRGTFKGKKQ